jgi:hypothetical protein
MFGAGVTRGRVPTSSPGLAPGRQVSVDRFRAQTPHEIVCRFFPRVRHVIIRCCGTSLLDGRLFVFGTPFYEITSCLKFHVYFRTRIVILWYLVSNVISCYKSF